MKRNNVKVCIRTRPTQRFAQNNIIIDEEHNTIQVAFDGGVETPGVSNNRQNTFKFKYDHVFHNSSQSSVYDLYVRDTVLGVVDGTNGAILSYGQTGSGKTFTMIGDTHNYEHRGVAPRAVNQLFSEINARIEIEYKVTITYMEIYNERIFDLLSDLGSPEQAADFTIIEERESRGTFVRGLTEVEVRDENEALNLLFSGELTRTTATHKLNRRSNRSHSLFTVYVQQRQRSGISEKVIHSKLHLVDLAGSERLKKTMDSMEGVAGSDVTKKESMCINQSLSYLEQCVIALARKSSHIPYRQSKLTNILKDCLGSNCNTTMLACVWGESDHLEETVSTLRLASRMMRVQNETLALETVDPSALIKKQAKLIKALKQELLMHDALVERAGVNYEPFTPEQQSSVAQMIEKYVEAKESEEEDLLNISSYRQMIEICKQFKKMVIIARSESAHAYGVDGRPLSTGDFLKGNDFGVEKIADEYDINAPMIGDKVGAGFALGTALNDSRPIGIDGISKFAAATGRSTGNRGNVSSPSRRDQHHSGVPESPDDTGMKSVGNDNAFESIGQGMAFDSYIKSEGRDMYDQYSQSKAHIKEIKLKSKDISTAVNEAKVKIDYLNKQIEIRKKSRIEMLRKSGLKIAMTEDIVDEEEFRLMQELRDTKRSYKNAFEQLQKNKSVVLQLQRDVDQVKNDIAAQFLSWSHGNTSTGNRHMDQYDGSADQLDDQEAFDRMETERVMASDPDSLAFFNAQKTQKAHITQHSGSIRQILKNKRVS